MSFCILSGVFQFQIMPYGLINAPANVDAANEHNISGNDITKITCPFVDAILHGCTGDEHLRNQEVIMNAVAVSGLQMKSENCTLPQEEMKVLRGVISKRGF